MKKKKRRIALLLSVIVTVAVVAAVAYLLVRNPFAPTGAWQLSSQVSGVGPQDTTNFTMNNQWRIIWSIQNRTFNLFIIDVYVRNGTSYSPIADDDESDTTALQGVIQVNYEGNFFIRVIAASDQEWNLQIEQFAKLPQ
jgi:hypothetical protein